MTNEFLDILFNDANIPIIVWDSSQVITRFNHAFEKLSGYDWNEVRDKRIDILFPQEKIGSTLELIKNTASDGISAICEIDILTKGTMEFNKYFRQGREKYSSNYCTRYYTS